MASSELEEYGAKGSFLNDQLFVQANYFEQERTNVSSQDVVTNQVSVEKGRVRDEIPRLRCIDFHFRILGSRSDQSDNNW